MIADFINGAFELLGGFFIALSVLKIHRSKKAEGIHWGHMAFFTAWGFWNLFYYPSLDQWASFTGGLLLVLVNCVYLGQVLYYSGFPFSRKTQHYIVEYGCDSDSMCGLNWLHGSLDDAKAIAARHNAASQADRPLAWAMGPADRHGPTWVAYQKHGQYRIRQ